MLMANNLIANALKTVALPVSTVSRGFLNAKSELTLALSGQTLHPFYSAKYLGIILDDHLSFKSHIEILENKIARPVRVITRLSYYLPFYTLIIIGYYTLVHSHLIHALPEWASTYKSYLIKLKKLRNKAARTISKTPVTKSITPLYYKFKVL